MPRHITAVFTINDEELFQPMLEKLRDHLEPSDGKPWAVTAMSMDHEIRRAELMAEAAERADDLCLRQAIYELDQHTDIGNAPDLKSVFPHLECVATNGGKASAQEYRK